MIAKAMQRFLLLHPVFGTQFGQTLAVMTGIRTAMCLPLKPFWQSSVDVVQLFLRVQHASSELPCSILLQVLSENKRVGVHSAMAVSQT